MKNVAIGSNKQKEAIIQLGLVPRFLQILDTFNDQREQEELLVETTAVINSVAKGSDEHSRCLIEAGTVPILFSVVNNHRNGDAYIEISLRALRSLFNSPFAPLSLIYDYRDGAEGLVSRLLDLASIGQSYSNQECVCSILARSLESSEKEKQTLQSSCGAISRIGDLLSSPSYKVQVAALNWLSNITFQNGTVSRIIVTTTPGKTSPTSAARRILQIQQQTATSGPPKLPQTIPDVLTRMMSQENPPEMQLLSAKCMTYLYRAESICAEDKRIVYKTLPTLIRSCKKDRDNKTRAEAAEVLAYLTEVDTYLQQMAAVCDQIIPTISSMLASSSLSSNGSFTFSDGVTCIGSHVNPSVAKKLEQEAKVTERLKQAAFKAFASLASQDDEIRKRIFDTEHLMEHIAKGVSDTDVKNKIAALQCLHSLSRAAPQMRSVLTDQSIWVPLLSLLSPPALEEVLILASSTVCNLLLEVSPTRPQHFVDRSSLDLLCNLTHRDEPALRMNGVWALMNMVYKAEQPIKLQILSCLGMDQIFRLLADTDVNVAMKTLGLLRNLLSTKAHIDHIMTLNGKEILDAILMILDSPSNPLDIKEQALCVLANIADGESSKDLLMCNDDVLNRLNSCLMDEGTTPMDGDGPNSNVRLQVAATFCITNLVWSEDDGSSERQLKLKEIGVYNNLSKLVCDTNSDTELFDKVKTALNEFNK